MEFMLFCILTILAFGSILAQLSPVVRTKAGPVQGKLIQFEPARQDVYQFTGIPFAEAPTGERRFKKPVPKAAWTSTLDATKPATTCIQVITGREDPFGVITADMMVMPMQVTEDCLQLNVWVPRATLDALISGKPTKALSVYVVVHGGGFVGGTSMIQLYNGTMISGFQNIIVVTMHYRLGSLGFAYFGKNDDAPGNVGLWDQTEALKWVCENIGSFGGNSSDVTLGGESAGAASVTYHLLTPYSRKYFQKAIVESGSAIAPWALHYPEPAIDILNIVLNLSAPASPAGQCNGVTSKSSIADKLKCLRSVDPWVIAQADGFPMSIGYASGAVPVIDGDYLPRDPGEMLVAGDFYKIPLIMGSNGDEGSMLYYTHSGARKMLPPESPLDSLNLTIYEKLIEYGFEISSIVPQPVHPVLFNAIKLHYWPTTHEGFPKGGEIIKAASSALGDYSLKCPTYSWASVAAQIMQNTTKNPIYVYHFTQPPPKGLLPEWIGPFHGEELTYVFGVAFHPFLKNFMLSEEDKVLTKIIMEYWGNFIKYGNPNIRDENKFCDPKGSPVVPTRPTQTTTRSTRSKAGDVLSALLGGLTNARPPGEVLSDLFQDVLGSMSTTTTALPANSSAKASCVSPDACMLRTWPPYIGKDCQWQIFEISVPTQVTQCVEPVSCAYKARDCVFWSEQFPLLTKLIGNQNPSSTVSPK